MTTMLSICCSPGPPAQPPRRSASNAKRLIFIPLSFAPPVRPEAHVAHLAALRALADVLVEREKEQPRIRGKRRHVLALAEGRRRARRGALLDAHEVLALARLAREVAELAQEAEAGGAAHQEPLLRVARAHPHDVVAAGIDQRVHVRAVAAAR